MKLLFLCFLLLTSCTDAVPKVSWLRDPDGPSLKISNYQIEEETEVIISGESRIAASQTVFFIKSDKDLNWLNVLDVLDTDFENDLDISDKTFKFKLNKNYVKDQVLKKAKNFSVKTLFSTNGRETKISNLTIDTESLTEFRADANTPEKDSNEKSLNLTISGYKVSDFAYKFGDNTIDCFSSNGYVDVAGLNLFIDLSNLSDGMKKLCIIGKAADGKTQNVQYATEKIWKLDTTPPSISILENIEERSNTLNFSFTVKSLDVEDPVVKYRYVVSKNESDCLNSSKYSSEKNILENISFTIDGDLVNSKIFLCLIGEDNAGNWTYPVNSYKVFWTNDIEGPQLPAIASSGINPSKFKSPEFSISYENASEIKTSFFKIIKNYDQSDLMDWGVLNLSTNMQITLPSNVEQTSYSLVLKLTDQSENITEGVVSTWTHDLTPPQLNVNIASESKSLQKSPTFFMGVSDNVGISSLKIYILDSLKQIISGPNSVSANSFYYHTMNYSRNQKYYLKVEATDFSSNQSIEEIEFTSANCTSTDPNDSSFLGGICEDVSINQTIGWKMQGGVIIAKESESKLIVVESLVGIHGGTGALSWGTLDTGHYIASSGFSGEKDPLQKPYNDSPVNFQCRTMNKNSLVDWFLPNLSQISKIFCNTSSTPMILYPSYDPGCLNSKIASVGNFGNVSFWTNSEYSPTRAISFNMGTGIETVENKTNLNDYICVRTFIR